MQLGVTLQQTPHDRLDRRRLQAVDGVSVPDRGEGLAQVAVGEVAAAGEDQAVGPSWSAIERWTVMPATVVRSSERRVGEGARSVPS